MTGRVLSSTDYRLQVSRSFRNPLSVKAMMYVNAALIGVLAAVVALAVQGAF